MKGRDGRGLIHKKESVMSETNTHKRPSHTVWFAPKRENARWTRIGALWPIKNGGFNIVLELVPRAEGGMVALPFNTRKEDEQDAE